MAPVWGMHPGPKWGDRRAIFSALSGAVPGAFRAPADGWGLERSIPTSLDGGYRIHEAHAVSPETPFGRAERRRVISHCGS